MNEPLGAFVVAFVEVASAPLRRRVTVHRTPLRFWSTSNSVSMRAPSALSLSFADEVFEHLPLARTSPSFASAAVGLSVATALTRPVTTMRVTDKGDLRLLGDHQAAS